MTRLCAGSVSIDLSTATERTERAVKLSAFASYRYRVDHTGHGTLLRSLLRTVTKNCREQTTEPVLPGLRDGKDSWQRRRMHGRRRLTRSGKTARHPSALLFYVGPRRMIARRPVKGVKRPVSHLQGLRFTSCYGPGSFAHPRVHNVQRGDALFKPRVFFYRRLIDQLSVLLVRTRLYCWQIKYRRSISGVGNTMSKQPHAIICVDTLCVSRIESSLYLTYLKT